MIKIEHPNLDKIIINHYEGVKLYVESVLDRQIAFLNAVQNSRYSKKKYLYPDDCFLESKTISTIYAAFFVKSNKKRKVIQKDDILNIISQKSQYIELVKHHLDSVKHFLEEIKTKVERIIIGKPNDLLKIEEYLLKNYSVFYKKNIPLSNELKEILNDAFDYVKFSSTVKNEKGEKFNGLISSISPKTYWGRFKFAENLGINTCCYCNRVFITTVIKKEGIIGPSLDHFFDKATYPLFALSFYNLIPSCTNCNSYLKHSKPFNYDSNLHPYEDGFGNDAKFYYEGDVDQEYGAVSPNLLYIKVKKKCVNYNKIKNNIEIFKLNEIYEHHADIVQELIWKRVASNERYLEEMSKNYANIGLTKDKAKSYLLAFSNFFDEKDFHKRPLAKLTKDIAERLGLI